MKEDFNTNKPKSRCNNLFFCDSLSEDFDCRICFFYKAIFLVEEEDEVICKSIDSFRLNFSLGRVALATRPIDLGRGCYKFDLGYHSCTVCDQLWVLF